MASAAQPQAPTPEKLQDAFDHGIWYALSLWPALHVACANGWGGPDTDDKKDWFAGAVSELLTTNPDTDSEDLEVFLLQVMEDEFELRVEDETEVEVARTILLLRKALVEDANLGAAKELEQRWKNRGQMKVDVNVADQMDREVDWDDAEEEDEDMTEAPRLVAAAPPREKVEPEVDDDGFTKVLGKKKR